jgi:hypothetical protein
LSEATVFSKERRVVFDKPVTRAGVELLLKEFLVGLGNPLAYGKAILGHIKVMARIPDQEDFLFLSLTTVNRVDAKPSPDWCREDPPNICSLELKVNVLVFGYSLATVEKLVEASLQKLSSCDLTPSGN